MILQQKYSELLVNDFNALPDTLDDLLKTLPVNEYEVLHEELKTTKYKLNQIKKNPSVASYNEVINIAKKMNVPVILLIRKYRAGFANIKLSQSDIHHNEYMESIIKNRKENEKTNRPPTEGKNTPLHSEPDKGSTGNAG